MSFEKKALLLVDAKNPPPDYRVENGTVGLGILWTAIGTFVVVAVWCGGILWRVASLNGKVESHEKRLKDLPNELLEKIDNKIENAVLRIEGTVNNLRSDVRHLQEDFVEGKDARSQTLQIVRNQLDRQGQENTSHQRELQEVRGMVQVIAGIQGQGNLISSPGHYQQPPSGRHNIQH